MIVASSKSDTLYSDLWDELTKLSPGERFPSVREIMKRYSVSQLTVDKAVSKLREDGYLHQVPGKGLFASDQVSRFNRTIKPTFMLAVPQWISADIDILENTVASIRESFPEHRLLINKFNVANTIPQQLPLMEENVTGLIVMPAGGSLTVEDIKLLTDLPVPLVVLGRHLDSFGITSVGTDDTFAGHLAAHYLAEHGHRKIGILLSEPHNRIIMERVKAITDYAELHEMEVQMVDCEVKSGEVAVDKAYRKFLQVIDEGFDFTALAGISGESMQGAVNACLNRGIKVPERLSMIAIGSEKVTETFHPPLTSAAVHFDRQVMTAINIIGDKIDDDRNNGGAYYIRPTIIELNSVRSI